MKKTSPKTNRSKKQDQEVRPIRALRDPDRKRELHPLDIKAVTIRFLLLLTPAIAALLAGYFLKSDMADFVCWWSMFYLYGWATFPLVSYFFRDFVSAGYGFSRSLGILLTTGPVWLISYLGIWESFNRPMTIVMFFILAAVCWGIPATRDSAVSALSQKFRSDPSSPYTSQNRLRTVSA